MPRLVGRCLLVSGAVMAAIVAADHLIASPPPLVASLAAVYLYSFHLTLSTGFALLLVADSSPGASALSDTPAEPHDSPAPGRNVTPPV